MTTLIATLVGIGAILAIYSLYQRSIEIDDIDEIDQEPEISVDNLASDTKNYIAWYDELYKRDRTAYCQMFKKIILSVREARVLLIEKINLEYPNYPFNGKETFDELYEVYYSFFYD